MHEGFGDGLAREALADRVANARSGFIGLWAPAGFGKNDFARRLASRYDGAQLVSARGVRDGQELLAAVPSSGTRIVLDTDGVDDASLEFALRELLATAGPDAPLVVSRMREPHMRVAGIIGPHRATVLRRNDLALAFSDLELFAAPYGVLDSNVLFRIHQFAHGWPVVARYLVRLAAEGLMDRAAPPLDHSCWTDLWDWIEVNVVDRLAPWEFDALCYCAVRTDVTSSDRRAFTPACAQALTRDTQLADVGFAHEIRVLPFLRHFLYTKRFERLEEEARQVSTELLERGERVAAARVLINVGALAQASEMLQEADEESAMLGNYPYPGITLETLAGAAPPYTLYPGLWYGLSTARRFVAPLHVLADEADEVLASNRLHERERWRILMRGTILHALNGNAERAEQLAKELDACPDADEAAKDIGWMYVEIERGDDTRAIERWDRSSWWLLRNPAFYSLALWEADRAMFRLEAHERARQGLRTMWSIARSSGSPYAAALAAAANDLRTRLSDDTEELPGTDLAEIVARYDIPGLWRSCAALLSIDYRAEPSGSPTNDLLALLILTESAPDDETRGAYARRLVDLGDRLRAPYLRVLVRAIAFLTGASSADAIDEARDIAAAHRMDRLIASLDALVSGEGSLGPLRHVAERLAKAPATVETSSSGVRIDFSDGSVSRAERCVSLSQHSYALAIALAVEPDISRDTLADRFWPDLDGDAATNALKTCVHRARMQLGAADAIVVDRGRYRLGATISSNYHDLVALGTMEWTIPLEASSRKTLSDTFERFVRAKRRWPQDWPWFAPYERALDQAADAIGDALMRDDLERGDRSGAIQRARSSIARNPLSESPRLALIELLASFGDRAGATQEYVDYRFVLLRELEAGPSPQLEALAGRLHLKVSGLPHSETSHTSTDSRRKTSCETTGGSAASR